MFGAVAAPDIEIAGRHFRRVALKVPKKEGIEELKGEVESISKLSHLNVVQILGMLSGRSKGSDDDNWMMALEWSHHPQP